MAASGTVTVKKRVTKTYNTGSSGSSGSSSKSSSSSGGSSGSSNKVSTGTYTEGDKYAGGNTFVRPDGSTYEHYGEFTSPSGKVTYTDNDGNVKVIKSSNKGEVGNIYNADGTVDKDYEMVARDYGIMQMNALQAAQERQQEAIDAAYRASANELNNSVADAQRQAYVNQQKALKNLPQTMAAAGYTGGVTETNAANISNEYQNALTDLERAKAQELARLQANRANGIAESNAQYDIQMANMLQQAQQAQIAQQRWDEEMKLRQAAALLEQDKLKLARDQWEAEQQPTAPTTPAQIVAPTTIADATQKAVANNDISYLAAYYSNLGLSPEAVAERLNRYTTDPTSAFYRA